MSRAGSAFQRAASRIVPESIPQSEETPPRRSATYKRADWADVPPLAIAMLVCGTRGDVQPFLALALGLKQDGHRVRLATHATFKDYVESYGVEFFPMGAPLQHMQAVQSQLHKHHSPSIFGEMLQGRCWTFLVFMQAETRSSFQHTW